MHKRWMIPLVVWSAAVVGCDSTAENRAEEEAEERAEARGVDPLTEERLEERAEERVEQAQHGAEARAPEGPAGTVGTTAPGTPVQPGAPPPATGVGTAPTGASGSQIGATGSPTPPGAAPGSLPPSGTMPSAAAGTGLTGSSGGIVRVQSERPLRDTMRQLERELTRNGMTILARMDYARAARNATPRLPPMHILVVGQPQAEAESLRADPTLALTNARQLLIYEDAQANGAAVVAYEEQTMRGVPTGTGAPAPSAAAPTTGAAPPTPPADLETIIRTATAPVAKTTATGTGADPMDDDI